MRRARCDRRGVALMLVLWLIVVLGVVATAIATASHADTTLARNLRARATARYAAESGIAVARQQLETLLESAGSSEERARSFSDVDRHFSELRDVAVGSGRFGLAVVDLNTRLDVNRSGPDMVRGLLAQFTDNGHAERAAAAVADWIDADDVTSPGGAEAREYAAMDSPYVPRNAPLDRLDELAHVLFVGDSLAAAVAPYVTTESDGLVNLNSAPEPVIAALPGIGPGRARALVARRLAGETFTSPAALQDFGAALPYLTILPTRLLIVSRGWLDGHALTHEIQAVYGIAGTRLYLMTWRERDL
jgi:general secretion pathway protein K